MNSAPDWVFLAFGTIVFGCGSIIVWLFPKQHRASLRFLGRAYRRWDAQSEEWYASEFFFWLSRFAVTAGFMLCVAILVRLLR